MPSENTNTSSGSQTRFHRKTSPTTQLVLPANQRFLSILQGYVHELCLIAGLSDIDLFNLELASEEAFVNILEHAYPDCKPGEIYIEGTITPNELVLSFRDEGIPFHESPTEYSYHIATDGEIQTQGLGFQIIRHTVDEVWFENLGKQGKVLHLVKKLPDSQKQEPVLEVHAITPAPSQHYEIREMRDEEAKQVTRLFWLVYGYTYKNEDFYRPLGLLELIRTGRLVNLVAIGEDGEVAGHVGLIRYEPNYIAEIALLVVSPAHRGRGIMTFLEDGIYAKAADMGLSGLLTNPVTSHNKSQKGFYRRDFVPCSLDLAACPPRMFKALASDNIPEQRESYLHCFKYLSPPSPVCVFVPDHHHAIITRIYENLHQPCTAGRPSPADSPGDYRVFFDRSLQKGIITVIIADERQWPEILRVVEDMVEFAGAEVVDLDLPLSQPATGLLFELAESAGFFFTGIRPCQAEDGDHARLQRVCVPFDLRHIQIYPGFGEYLLNDIASRMADSQR